VQSVDSIDQQGVEVLKFSRKATIVASSLALLIVTSVVAYAFWSNLGGGTGTATTGEALGVNQTSTVTGLYPGGPAVGLFGNFNNPNSNPVHVNHVTASLTDADVPDNATGGPIDADHPACMADDFEINGPATVNQDIPSGNPVGAWGGITIRMVNKTTNQDNCKNPTLSIHYTTD
jgi:hypothetical protein